MEDRGSGRLGDLQERFAALEPRLRDTPEKEAISVLHAMIQEAWRTDRSNGHGWSPAIKPTLRDVADLYKTAPPMAGEGVNDPLPVRSTAPEFSLPDASGKDVSLSDFRGRPVVLAFYPLDWSPTCSDQLSLYQAELREFERYDAAVLGVSVDSIYSHGAWAAVRGLTIPLLSDFQPRGEVARWYHAYRPQDGFSERALYVVDKDGLIRYANISPQLDHIPDIYELFECLADITGKAPARSGATEPVEIAAAVAGGPR